MIKRSVPTLTYMYCSIHRVLVVNIFSYLFAFAIFDLVHDVKAMFHLSGNVF